MRTVPLALTLLLSLSACERDVYTVRMKSTADGFDRHLEVVRLDANGARKRPPADVLDPIQAIYGSRPDTPEFDAGFHNMTPTDIGGRGSLSRAGTSLGTTYVYMERFRGDDDTSARIARIQTAASTAASLFLGWLDSALADEPAWPALRAALADGRLDRDFRNIALIVWLEKNAGRVQAPRADPADNEALLVRIASYLLDHGYITSDQLPLGPSLMEGQGPRRLLASWLARGMSVDVSGLPPALADDTAMAASWQRYLDGSPQARRALQTWAAAADVPEPAGEPAAQQLIDHLTTIATGSEPSDAGAEDEVHLSLACPVEPITTNGAWSAAERQITWWFNIEPSPDTAYLLPAVAFAAWAEPDDDFQTAHFGSVSLRGEALAAYCAWHARLTQSERTRWDAFIDALSPGATPRSAIQAYTPSEDPAWAAERNGRTILLDALDD